MTPEFAKVGTQFALLGAGLVFYVMLTLVKADDGKVIDPLSKLPLDKIIKLDFLFKCGLLAFMAGFVIVLAHA